MRRLRRLIPVIVQGVQFRVNLGGSLFIEYLLASCILSIISAGALLITGSMYLIWVVILFFLTRLILVFKRDGFLALLGALIGELFIVIFLVGFVYIGLSVGFLIGGWPF